MYPPYQDIDGTIRALEKFKRKEEKRRIRGEEEQKRKSPAKKSWKSLSTLEVAALLLLCYPLIGPWYNYAMITSIKHSLEMLQNVLK